MNAPARAVRIAALGHCSALGSNSALAGRTLAGRIALPEPPAARRNVLGREYAWHALPLTDTDWYERARRAVQAVGAELRDALPAGQDWAGLPLFFASSSLQVGALEAAARRSCQVQVPHDAALFAAEAADWLGLRDVPRVFSTTCTSGFAALEAAAGLIASGRLERAVVLGLELANDITLAGFAALGLLASDDADGPRGGLVLGEAVAGVLLEADDAPGWHVAGCRLGLDGHSPTGPAPDGERIARTLRAALADAGLTAADIDLLKPHCGGLAATDEPEARALETVFGAAPPPRIPLKAHLGHTLGASGLAELSALLAAFDNDAPMPCTTPRHLLLNLIGFGGSIAALVVARREAAA